LGACSTPDDGDSKFVRKQEDAIAALITHRNTEEAASAVGISAKTLRWMKEPKFDAAYQHETDHSAPGCKSYRCVSIPSAHILPRRRNLWVIGTSEEWRNVSSFGRRKTMPDSRAALSFP
jgi:hypothetical protein